jgi:hypothetical protein
MSETLESVIIKDLIENLNLWAERYSGKPISLTLFRSSAILGELERRRDEAREKIKNQAERICVLEGATNHACGTPLTRALRERDEAQKELSSIHRWIERNHPDGFIDSLTYLQNLERITENWYDRLDRLEIDAGRFERGRDEAREEVKELIYIAERAIDLAEIDFENDKFGVVSELRDGMERIKERAKCFVCTPEQKCWECADDTSLKERAK